MTSDSQNSTKIASCCPTADLNESTELADKSMTSSAAVSVTVRAKRERAIDHLAMAGRKVNLSMST